MFFIDGGFHKRSCFLGPDMLIVNIINSYWINLFNTTVSRGRCIVENGIGLFKMKFRRFHQHSVAEKTEIIPELILCAVIFHNICIDAGDVNNIENAAVRDEADRIADQFDLHEAVERVMHHEGINIRNNAVASVLEYRNKLVNIYDLWRNGRDGGDLTLAALRIAYGPAAHAFNDNIL